MSQELIKYKESLVPVIKRESIFDNIDNLVTDFNNKLLPELEACKGVGKLQAKTSKSLADAISRIAKLPSGVNVFESLQKGLAGIDDNLGIVRIYVRKEMSESIATANLTIRQAGLLRYVELAQFAYEYTFRLIRYILNEELKAKGSLDTDSISSNEVAAVNDHMLSYAGALLMITADKSKIDKTIKDAPGVEINDTTVSLVGNQLTKDMVDDSKGFIALRYNPIYHFRVFLADLAAKKYKRTKEQLRMFEIQRIRLDNLRSNRNDPILDKEAEELSGIINELQHGINKLEKEYV